MNDAFLLGAGFSKAIARTMPTMPELYAKLEPLIGTADGFTRGAYDYAAGNVETLLSYYAVPSPMTTWLKCYVSGELQPFLKSE